MPELRIYLIGAGVIARTHAATAAALLEATPGLLAVADPSPTAREQFQAEHPFAVMYESAEAMLAEPAADTDIAIVATPPATHADLSCAALASGRHVLCEKPLAMDAAQARRMLAAASQAGRLLGCCSSRFLGVATSEAVKQLLGEGGLGELYHMRFIQRLSRARPGLEYQPASRWFLDSSKSGGGVLMDWGPYDFTVMNDLLAPQAVEVLSAWSATPATELQLSPDVTFDVEHHVGASLRYHLPHGPPLAVSYERAACTHGEEQAIVELEGTRGAVRWDWLCWEGAGELVHAADDRGRPQRTALQYQDRSSRRARPLYGFLQAVQGQPSPALLNEQAVFNFLCLRAIYDCIASAKPQVVRRSDLA